MNVCFFRHGPAAPQGKAGDESRRLTADGRRKTRAAARGFKELGLGLDFILTSPLVRAVETAEFLAEVLGLATPSVSELLRPGVPPARLLAVLGDYRRNSPILVGHEPTLSAAVSHLAGAARLELKKAGMAFARVDALAPRPRGTLLLLLTPAALRRLSR